MAVDVSRCDVMCVYLSLMTSSLCIFVWLGHSQRQAQIEQMEAPKVNSLTQRIVLYNAVYEHGHEDEDDGHEFLSVFGVPPLRLPCSSSCPYPQDEHWDLWLLKLDARIDRSPERTLTYSNLLLLSCPIVVDCLLACFGNQT